MVLKKKFFYTLVTEFCGVPFSFSYFFLMKLPTRFQLKGAKKVPKIKPLWRACARARTHLNFVEAQLRVGIPSLNFVERVLGHLDLVRRFVTTKFGALLGHGIHRGMIEMGYQLCVYLGGLPDCR